MWCVSAINALEICFFVLFFNGLSDWHSAKNVVSEENRAEIRKKNNILSKNCINFHSIFSCFKRKVKMLKITKSCFLWVLRTEKHYSQRLNADWLEVGADSPDSMLWKKIFYCFPGYIFVISYRSMCTGYSQQNVQYSHVSQDCIRECTYENELCNVYPSIIITNAVYLPITLCTFVYISWS